MTGSADTVKAKEPSSDTAIAITIYNHSVCACRSGFIDSPDSTCCFVFHKHSHPLPSILFSLLAVMHLLKAASPLSYADTKCRTSDFMKRCKDMIIPVFALPRPSLSISQLFIPISGASSFPMAAWRREHEGNSQISAFPFSQFSKCLKEWRTLPERIR